MNLQEGYFKRDLKAKEMLLINYGTDVVGICLERIIGNCIDRKAGFSFSVNGSDPYPILLEHRYSWQDINSRVNVLVERFGDYGSKIVLGCKCPTGSRVQLYDADGELKSEWTVRNINRQYGKRKS